MVTIRGKSGASMLARPPRQITLRDIYRASGAPPAFAIHSGDIRKDLDPIDLLRALTGVLNVASSPDWQQSAGRLVDILVTGSRPIKYIPRRHRS